MENSFSSIFYYYYMIKININIKDNFYLLIKF